HRLQFETDGATIEALGTRFVLFRDAKRHHTWVIVMEGAVKLTTSAGSVTIPATFQSWAGDGQPPQPPVAASRSMIGARFPAISVLTNRWTSDANVLVPNCVVVAGPLRIYLRPYVTSRVIGNLLQGQVFRPVARTSRSTWIVGATSWSPDGHQSSGQGWVEAR